MSSAKLVDVSLNVDAALVLDEAADDATTELLDEAALLDDDELGVLLAKELDELGVSVGALELVCLDEPPPQAASERNDKYKMALHNFMAITCLRY